MKPKHGQAKTCNRGPLPQEGARVEGSGLVLLVSSHDVLQDIVAAHGLNVYWMQNKVPVNMVDNIFNGINKHDHVLLSAG